MIASAFFRRLTRRLVRGFAFRLGDRRRRAVLCRFALASDELRAAELGFFYSRGERGIRLGLDERRVEFRLDSVEPRAQRAELLIERGAIGPRTFRRRRRVHCALLRRFQLRVRAVRLGFYRVYIVIAAASAAAVDPAAHGTHVARMKSRPHRRRVRAEHCRGEFFPCRAVRLPRGLERVRRRLFRLGVKLYLARRVVRRRRFFPNVLFRIGAPRVERVVLGLFVFKLVYDAVDRFRTRRALAAKQLFHRALHRVRPPRHAVCRGAELLRRRLERGERAVRGVFQFRRPRVGLALFVGFFLCRVRLLLRLRRRRFVLAVERAERYQPVRFRAQLRYAFLPVVGMRQRELVEF